jgi:hypothetical protein
MSSGNVRISTGINDLRAFLSSINPLREREYIEWTAKRRKVFTPAVFDPLLEKYRNFFHEFLFEIKPDEIRRELAQLNRDRREHALGDVRWDKSFKPIADASGPPPLNFAFHILLEHYRRIPRWTEFYRFLEKHPIFFHDFFFRTVGFGKDDPRYDINGGGVMGALRWRLGNAYYSFVKETYLLSCLRHEHHIDARYHFLIDVEWKADIFAGDVLLEIYIGNNTYKSGDVEGRKERCRDKNPGAKVLELQSCIERVFGQVWLPKAEDIAVIAKAAIDAGAPRLADVH